MKSSPYRLCGHFHTACRVKDNQKKIFIFLILLSFLNYSCTFTYKKSEASEIERYYSKINSLGKQYKARVLLTDGDSYYVENINIDCDSTEWTESDSNVIKIVDTSFINKIIFIDHLKGAAGGFLFGFLGGLALSISSVLVFNDDSRGSENWGAGLAIIQGTIGGALLGTVFGSIKGDKIVFIINSPN